MKVASIIAVGAAIGGGLCQDVLTQMDKQTLYDRMYQTALRGARLRELNISSARNKPPTDDSCVAASAAQNSMLDSVADALSVAGLTTSTLNYTMFR